MGLEHVPLMGGAMPDAKDQSHHAPQRPIQVYQLDGNILVPLLLKDSLRAFWAWVEHLYLRNE